MPSPEWRTALTRLKQSFNRWSDVGAFVGIPGETLQNIDRGQRTSEVRKEKIVEAAERLDDEHVVALEMAIYTRQLVQRLKACSSVDEVRDVVDTVEPVLERLTDKLPAEPEDTVGNAVP